MRPSHAQTCCALSGEAFEQFWDEGHQEWRYRGAKALDAEEAARQVQGSTLGPGSQPPRRGTVCSPPMAARQRRW